MTRSAAILAVIAAFIGMVNCMQLPFSGGSATRQDVLSPVSRSFSRQEFQTMFTLLTQFSNGNAPTCPLYVEHGAMPIMGNLDKGSYFILHNMTKAGGVPGRDEKQPIQDLLNQCTDDGYLEVFHSYYLRGGLVLDELRDAINVDLTSLWANGTQRSMTSSQSEFTYLSALFESAWKALRGKQWWAGKANYEISDSGPSPANGRVCGSGSHNRHFFNGELFLFIDEPEVVTMKVALDAFTTAPIHLNGNQRYMIVVGEDSTCIYNVFEDSRTEGDQDTFQCHKNCTCKC